MLSNTTIADLQNILHEEFGIECTLAEAAEIATGLTQYAEVLIDINKNDE
jgi:hypothetical protein